MKNDQENLIFFTPNKIIILAIISIITCLLYYLNLIDTKKSQQELDKTLIFLYPNIDESIQYTDINGNDATKLMNYFFNKKGDTDRGKFWNHICLFYHNNYCKQFSVYWGLKQEHNSIREKYFLEGKDNLYSLVVGEKNTEENRCYVIFYETQNDLEKNKKKFLDNYSNCRKYYVASLPALVEYEENFLKIFK